MKTTTPAPPYSVEQYKYIEDPGHGWLEVPKEEVIRSGAEISPYSYEDKRTGKVYLEEDCDACRFLAAIGALKDSEGEYVRYPSEHQDPCFVRDLPSFSSPKTEGGAA